MVLGIEPAADHQHRRPDGAHASTLAAAIGEREPPLVAVVQGRLFEWWSAGTGTPDAAGPATVCPGLHERPEVVEEGADGCERLGVLRLGRLDVARRGHFLLVRSDAVPLVRLA